MIDKDNNVIMKNLNPKESGKNNVSKQLFPPDEEDFYKTLQSDEFKKSWLSMQLLVKEEMQLQNILKLMWSRKMINQHLCQLKVIINCSYLSK